MFFSQKFVPCGILPLQFHRLFCKKFFVKKFVFPPNFFYSTFEPQSLKLTKETLIKLLRESLKSLNYQRLNNLTSNSLSSLSDILDITLHRFDKNSYIPTCATLNTDDEDFVQSFDLLIIWKSLCIVITKGTIGDINQIIGKLVKVTQAQIPTFPFIRLTLVLHEMSKLFKYIESLFSLDSFNQKLAHYISQLNESAVDSHSLCLLFNYIANAPCNDLNCYNDLLYSLLEFIKVHSRGLNYSNVDYLLMYKSANKLYLRQRHSEVAKIALESLDNYVKTTKNNNVIQIVRLTNQLLSNFRKHDLLTDNDLFNNVLGNILQMVNDSCEETDFMDKKTFNLIKRLNILVH